MQQTTDLHGVPYDAVEKFVESRAPPSPDMEGEDFYAGDEVAFTKHGVVTDLAESVLNLRLEALACFPRSHVTTFNKPDVGKTVISYAQSIHAYLPKVVSQENQSFA